MKKGSLNWSFASSKILPVADAQQGINIQSTLIWWTTSNNEFHWIMGAHQTFGVIMCTVTSLGGFSSAEEMNSSAANRCSWDNTENSWGFCSRPVLFPGFHWTLGRIRDLGRSLFFRIESCCSTEQLPDKCKHVAGVFYELFPWVEMLCPRLQGFIAAFSRMRLGRCHGQPAGNSSWSWGMWEKGEKQSRTQLHGQLGSIQVLQAELPPHLVSSPALLKTFLRCFLKTCLSVDLPRIWVIPKKNGSHHPLGSTLA